MSTLTVNEQLVAERIGYALRRRQIRPEDVAAALGITERAVYHWLAGRRRPRAHLLIRLAELSTVDAAWLMGR